MGKSRNPRAVIYGRSSTANEKSITDQLAENRAAAAGNGWTVAEELSDPTSASRFATKVRANWARLLELVPDTDVIVLWEPSRGDRTLASWIAFVDRCRQHGTRLHATSHRRTYDPANSRDYRSLAEDGVDSSYESDRLSERVSRGKRAAYAAGRPSNRLTYGYRRVYDTTRTPPAYLRQEPHPAQARIVRRIFRELAAGHTLHMVTKRLNDDGVATAGGARYWRPNVVRDMASNPTYRPHPDNPKRGCLVRNGTTYVGTWPPLATETQWQAVATTLGATSEAHRKARKDSAPGRVRYLLSTSFRLMTSPCGGDLLGFPDRPGRRAHYACRRDGCASVAMAEADEFVTRLVVARLSRPDARDLWVADDQAARDASEELARLRAELEEARDSFAAPGGISAAALAKKEAAMAGPIADAERRSRPAGAPLAVLELIDAAAFGAQKVRPVWDRLPVTARREVVSWLLELRLGPVAVRVTVHTPPEERLAIVADRITVAWRSGP
ncbi:MAG: recombinase family protein [Natronosporangium sp.]